ncbi:hypothetical protein ULMS_29250 [Patiriisocius marinistellae]|uniref:Uncharacterized protein n=1 Tax=Patiriisocius marinistellae TaxID=2494560 RepID=A0A5J4FXC9_9FLAO|nr:hypothetical protein [Patiriisocius marinistellae]GEQ87417.1 hypothetical protein ULMS_29250 [Patiriisocius marinistellae]
MIKIKVLDIDEGDDLIHYHIFVDNGICSVGIEVYEYDDAFQKFAEELITFPKNVNDEVKFEIGEKDKKWAFYFMIKVYCYLRNGQSALKIDAWNNGDEETEYNASFTLKAEPASLNRLGNSLKNWNPKSYQEFEWKEFA